MKQHTSNNNIQIIALGASASGLRPLKAFFSSVSTETTAFFVVIQHLAPDYKSMIQDLLSHTTSLPIKVIEHGMQPEPGTIYLNPPKKTVTIPDGVFHLEEKERELLTFPITTFFESMAAEYDNSCCAIVLSGTGSDGSEGLKKVREAGGYTLAQNPEEAEFDGMPNSAINTGMVDQVLPVSEMFERVQSMIEHQMDEKELNDEERVNTILKIIKEKTDTNFSEYKRSTIQRRIARRLTIVGSENLDDYITFLRDDENEAERIANEMLIGVTHFFRDWESYKRLREKVLPALFERADKQPERKIRVWVPACSTGEEAYSLAILLDDFARKQEKIFDITIFATDLDAGAIKKAGSRFFPTSVSKYIPEEFLSNYFIPQTNGYHISREIRDMVVFSVHNLIQEPPFSKIDLISCRNLLIYLNADAQRRTLSLFQYALQPDGFLFLGDSESVGGNKENFPKIDPKAHIYQNVNSTTFIQHPSFQRGSKKTYTGKLLNTDYQSTKSMATISSKQLNEALIQQFVPYSVVINNNFKVLHTTGNARRYLSVPLGNMSDNLLDMIPSTWVVAFEVAVEKAKTQETAVKLEQLQLEKDDDSGEEEVVDVAVKRLHLHKVKETLYMINFSKWDSESPLENRGKAESIILTPETTQKITSLEQELDVSRENLQLTIEELESSSEELQASNEELQSSNEELESINEELSTINSEYEEKVKELTVTNDDLKNLLNSTQLAILFLDEDLNIRRFTEAIKQILKIDKRDVGRSVHDFTSRLPLHDYVDKMKEVQELLVPFETSMTDTEGRTFILRMTPFRTVEDEIHGVVLSFVNISELRTVKEELETTEENLHKVREDYDQQHELFRLIANNASDVVGIHEMDGKYTFVSPSSKDVFGYTPDEVIGKSPLDFLHPEDLSRIERKYDKGLRNVETNKPVEFRVKTKWGDYVWVESTMRHITDSSGRPVKMLSSTRNITDRIERVDELRLLSSIVENAHEAIMITDADLNIEYVNNSFSHMTGYKSREVLGRKPQDFLYGEESDPETLALIQEKLAKEEMFEIEVLNYRKNGSTFWNSVTCKPLFKQDNTLRGYFAIQTDVTSKKLYQEQLNQFTHKLEEKNQKLTRMNEELQEFAYIASHDLKEPVRAIIGVLDLVEHSINATGRDAELLTKATERARRMDKMINLLLEYSRSGRVSEEKVQVQLSEILDLVMENLAESIQKSGAKISLLGEDKKLTAYPTMFQRLLQNLISNSIKYTSEDKTPEIEVSVVEDGENDGSVIKVKDNGMGIPKEYQKEIFRLFRRGSRSVEHDSNGLGLAISKRIAEHHNGNIWVESIEGEGSTFFVRINLK